MKFNGSNLTHFTLLNFLQEGQLSQISLYLMHPLVTQLVATDHCPFNSTQKALGKDDFRIIPNGVNGKY